MEDGNRTDKEGGNRTDKEGGSLLSYVVESGEVEAIRYLLDLGVTVSTKMPNNPCNDMQLLWKESSTTRHNV